MIRLIKNRQEEYIQGGHHMSKDEMKACLSPRSLRTFHLVLREQESWGSIYHLQCWGPAIHSGHKRTINTKAIWMASFLHQVSE